MFVVSFNSCNLNQQNGYFINSSIQIVDMGKFKGLKSIEIATLSYPEASTQTQASHVFNEIDIDNFNDTLIQSLKRSDVRVLPSAQTKIHIKFFQLAIAEETKGSVMIITANVEVSRNGIITRKTIKIDGKPKRTIASTKDNSVKIFIQELGELLREQSSFKR